MHRAHGNAVGTVSVGRCQPPRLPFRPVKRDLDSRLESIRVQGCDQLPTKPSAGWLPLNSASRQQACPRITETAERAHACRYKPSRGTPVMLHLRACYVSKAAILTVPAPCALVENRSPA